MFAFAFDILIHEIVNITIMIAKTTREGYVLAHLLTHSDSISLTQAPSKKK